MKEDSALARRQELLELFQRGQNFTKELLQENQKLRLRVAQLETTQNDAQAHELARVRVDNEHLQQRLNRLEQRFVEVEAENKEFADRYIEIEEQNNNLANLYVASYQLHSTLDFREVIRIVQEIVINLIGAEAFHVFMVSEKTGHLELEASEGQEAPVTSIPVGEGLIGRAAQTGENYFSDQVAHREATPFDQPIAVIPLKIKESVIGVIALNKLLVQKTAFTTMDYELFTLLAGHAATAVFSAKLYSASARKLTTLQGFLDMLKQPGKP